jgi:hypothetical protein
MEDSILLSTKTNLGVDGANTAFDAEILTGINTAFSTLSQLGLGPVGGFTVDGEEEIWDDFILGDERLNGVKTYVQLHTKLLFDTSGLSSYALAAFERQLEELKWRLNDIHEETRA